MEIMPGDPFYSEKEAAEIIRRAGELQEEKAEEGYAPGIAAEELRRLALDVGIKPEYFEQALSERRGGADVQVSKKTIERIVPVEVDPADFDMITDVLKVRPMSTAGNMTTGGVSQFGRTIMGQASESWDNPHFKVNSRGGRSKIEVWSDKSVPVGMTVLWLLPLIFSPVLGKVAGPLWGAIMAVVCCILAVFSYRALDKKSNESSVAVADKLEKAILDYGEQKKSELESRLSTATDQSESTRITVSE